MPQLITSRVPAGFAEATAPANGITINYVRGGTGPTLVLLHGYPQTWYMWRKVLPAVAEHFTVIAPDLRGAGGSDAPTEGYTKSSLADDIYDLLVGLGLAEQVSVVGHDIGTMVAYAYAVRTWRVLSATDQMQIRGVHGRRLEHNEQLVSAGVKPRLVN